MEQCGERTQNSTGVGNADASEATVRSVKNPYMHGALLAKGATAVIEHSEHWKTLLIHYISHKPTDNPYAHPSS
jgi:hypothetical protein